MLKHKILSTLAIILFIGLINLISAITVDTTSVILDINHTSKQIIFSNPSNSTIQVNYNFDSSISDKITENFGDGDFGIGASSSSTMTINLKPNLANGVYYGNLNWNDGNSGFIPIIISINNPIQETGCRLNPSIVSYTQNVVQSTVFELPKISFNPSSECPGTFNIQSAYITGGIQTNEGQKPVFIKSAGNNEITLGVNTEGLSSRTYNTKLTVTAFSKTFSDISNINIIVTSGTSMGGSCDINNLPVCSLSKSIINLNETASLVCTNINADLNVIPQADDNYIVGIGVENPTGQFVWNFKGTNYITETTIKGYFYCLNSPFGAPFSSKIKILSTGASSGGTNLDFLFTPNLNKVKPGESFIIQLIDNRSGSLVSNPELFIDAVKHNNSDGYSFITSFEFNKNFSLRGMAPGYENIIQTFFLTSKEINLIIFPSSGDANTDFNITSDANASIFLDGTKLSDGNYFGKISSGTHTIKSIVEGYYDKEINLTVGMGLYASLGSEFKKSAEQLIFLSQNCTWKVTYSKTSNETLLITGNSSEIRFTPEKSGIYKVYCSDTYLSSYEIKGWWKNSYLLWGLIPLAILILYLVIKNKSSSSGGMPGLAGKINYE